MAMTSKSLNSAEWQLARHGFDYDVDFQLEGASVAVYVPSYDAVTGDLVQEVIHCDTYSEVMHAIGY